MNDTPDAVEASADSVAVVSWMQHGAPLASEGGAGEGLLEAWQGGALGPS